MAGSQARIDSFDFPAGRVLAGKYQVEDFLGSGYEAEVYRVSELRTGIRRAAKIFYPQRNPRDRAVRFYARKLDRLRKCPILIPRRGRMAEHVDDHQLQIALDFALRDLAIVRDAAFLKDADLVTAASRVVRRVDAPRLRISANQVSADGQLLIPQPRSGDSIAGQIPV